MVVYDGISFPVSASPSILLATANVPYGSTDGINTTIQLVTPVGFSFRVENNQSPNAQTITATINAITSVNVFKNGSFLTTQNLFNPFTSISKSYSLGSATGLLLFNSYMQQLIFSYKPTTLPSVNTTDVYTFYASFSFTLSSTKTGAASFLQSLNADSINYGIIAKTTTSTSSFNNMSYAAGSSNSTGYVAYNLTSFIPTGNDWSIFNQGYVPLQNKSLWTGFYTIATLYARSAYFTDSIFLKNTGSTATITWLQADGSAGSLAYASLLSNAFNFNVESALTNGFRFLFNGSTIASISTDGIFTMASTPRLSYTTNPTYSTNQIGYFIQYGFPGGSASTRDIFNSSNIPVGLYIFTTSTTNYDINTSTRNDIQQTTLNNISNLSGSNLEFNGAAGGKMPMHATYIYRVNSASNQLVVRLVNFNAPVGQITGGNSMLVRIA